MRDRHIQDSADLVWRQVEKNYSDPGRPAVRVLDAGEVLAGDLGFFASDGLLGTSRADTRVLVLGCGQAAVRGALPALSPGGRRAGAPAPAPFFDFGLLQGVRVTGIADLDLRNLLSAARWFGVPHADRDALHLMRSAPAEGAVICTPPAWHTPLALEALRLQQSVLVEKPAASTHGELGQLLASLKEHPGLEVVVNLPYAHHPALAVLRDTVSAGSLGAPRSFTVTFEHGGPLAWAPRASWYSDSRGGVIADLGVHVFDAVERIFGTPVGLVRPVSDIWQGERGERGGTLVRAAARVETGGCSGTVEVGWDAPGPRFAVAVHFGDAIAEASLIPFRAPGASVEVRSAGTVRRLRFGPPPAAGGGPYGDFAAVLRDGTPSRTGLAAVAGAVRSMLDWVAAALGGQR